MVSPTQPENIRITTQRLFPRPRRLWPTEEFPKNVSVDATKRVVPGRPVGLVNLYKKTFCHTSIGTDTGDVCERVSRFWNVHVVKTVAVFKDGRLSKRSAAKPTAADANKRRRAFDLFPFQPVPERMSRDFLRVYCSRSVSVETACEQTVFRPKVEYASKRLRGYAFIIDYGRA